MDNTIDAEGNPIQEDPYNFNKALAVHADLRSERQDWEAEWRSLSDFLLPGRGIYQTYSKPPKRKLTSTKVVNSTGEDALYVLVSGMAGALTSPSRPWAQYGWVNKQINKIPELKAWMQDASEKMHQALHMTSFYSDIVNVYTEAGGFGTAAMYVGEDTEPGSDIPFRFETLTVGEYSFSVRTDGITNQFFRTIYLSTRQLVERFPKTASNEAQARVERNEAGVDKVDVTVLEWVVEKKNGNKPFTRYYYEIGQNVSTDANVLNDDQMPLEVSGFHEFPYIVARWGTIGSDVYGIGPGSRALKDIKRLQEMEKSFLMAVHKDADPPLNVPARLRGKVNRMPGGVTYYANPNETVNELYRAQFNFQGVTAAIERVEMSIKEKFFNDIFITATRDPNASPLKATQVDKQDREGMLRMGPVVERFQHEFLVPLLTRCFNIMLRKGLFEPLDPGLAKMAGDFEITLISPLATAQRAVAMQGINTFLAGVGQMAQYDQQVLDKVNADGAVDELADITGVKIGAVVRTEEQVKAIREQRAAAQKQQQQKEEMAQAMGMQAQMDGAQATAQKTQAEASLTQLEGQQVAQEMGY